MQTPLKRKLYSWFRPNIAFYWAGNRAKKRMRSIKLNNKTKHQQKRNTKGTKKQQQKPNRDNYSCNFIYCSGRMIISENSGDTTSL